MFEAPLPSKAAMSRWPSDADAVDVAHAQAFITSVAVVAGSVATGKINE